VDRYAVIGNPVEHSLSPRIHAWFAEQTRQALEYGRLLAPLDGFVAVASEFFDAGGKGANVTVPFKGEAAAWVDELDPLAMAAGAVNTIKHEDGRLLGFNTDGVGLVRDLEVNQRWTLRDRRILMIGAGGAARGVVGPVLAAGAGELVIANRTPRRAEELVAQFAGDAPGNRLRAVAFTDLKRSRQGAFDLLINATSAGLRGDLPAVDPALVEGAWCYDMVYGHQTAFCTWAAQHGARGLADGIGMLVEQAAVAFRIWRGIHPETASVLDALRSERERQ
jgi:shikimate dehydrogenase